MAVGVNHMIAIQALDRFEVLSIINCLDFRVEGCNNLCVFLHYMGYLSGVVPMYTRQISLYFFFLQITHKNVLTLYFAFGSL